MSGLSLNAQKPVVWSVAGSDNSGGAGIQADNLVFHEFGVHGCNVITAVTAQNSRGVAAVNSVTEAVFSQQWEALLPDYAPAVIKLGMLGSAALVSKLAHKLGTLQAVVVCDPVLRATSGGELIDSSRAYQQLLPLVDILTPNQQEFAALSGMAFSTPQELEACALTFARRFGLDLVVTGGDSAFAGSTHVIQSSDLCIIDGEKFWLHSPRMATRNTHGSGCTLASAIAAALACGYDRQEAVVLAKAYINQGLRQAVAFAAGNGPIQHAGFPSQLQSLPLVSCEFSVSAVEFPRCDSLCLGTYPVVDSLEWLERCLQAGVRTLQLRVKHVPEAELDRMVARAVALGRDFNARLFINDYWQLAIKHRAYGVHLGQEDLDVADLPAIAAAGLHLGVSTHSWYEIARAHSLRPSYIAIGPIYATTTKVMKFAPQGLQQLRQWVELVGNAYPVVAIGGIDLANAAGVLATGVGSVAMVRAVTEAGDYREAIRQFDRLVHDHAQAV